MTIRHTIETYRKRRQNRMPLILGGMALVLAVIGIFIIALGVKGGGGIHLFSTRIPSPTISPLPSTSPTISETPTITSTPTNTATPTASAPYDYVVKEGDTLSGIVKDLNLGENGLVLILILNPYAPENLEKPGIDPNTQIIFVGKKITLPNSGMQLPSPTPWPVDADPGTRINYMVLPNDNLAIIAARLNSTVDAIVRANTKTLTEGITTVIYPGQVLVVPVNLVTAVPTVGPTATSSQTATPSRTATRTPTQAQATP